ncbi:uncharacterized protein CBL_05456 [Carabus blaptoides fortunei]
MRFIFSWKVSSSNKSKKWPQILAVLLASFSSIAVGIHFAWPSPSMPIILSDDFPVNVTSEESSYIIAIRPLGNMLAAPLAGYLVDIIGRKYTVLMIALPTFISWMTLGFANSVLEFYIGRFISGFGDGFYFIGYSMYVGEVTEPSIRGVVCGNIAVQLMFGMLLISCYGPYVSIRDGAIISSMFPILLVVCFIWMPESPYYLIMKHKLDEAKKALYFLRRCNVDEEFQMLQGHIEKQVSDRGSYRDLFTIPSNRRALFILIGIRAFQQLTGIAGLTMYTQTIFTQAEINLSPATASIIYFTTLLVATAGGSVFSDKYGRRPTLILSSILTGIVHNIGGIYFLLQEVIGVDTSSIKWFPMVIAQMVGPPVTHQCTIGYLLAGLMSVRQY